MLDPEKGHVSVDIHRMHDAAVLVDVDGVILGINDAFATLSGWTEDELIGKPFEQLQAMISPPASSDGAMQRTYPYHRRSGGIFWGETLPLPLCGEDGELFGRIEIVQDVSARARRGGGLMAFIGFVVDQSVSDDADLSALLDLGCRYFDLELGVFCKPDADGDQILAVGGDYALVVPGEKLADPCRFSAMLPCDQGAAVIEHAATSSVADHPFYRRTGLETVLACALRSGECHDGTLYFADRRPKSRSFDGRDMKILHFMANWLSVKNSVRTTRQSYEQANALLVKSEQRYRHLYEKTPAMLHSIDDSGRLASVSDTWLAVMGFEREEVIGRPSTDFLTDQSKRYAIDVVLPRFKAEGRCDDIEYQFVTKSGDVRDVLLSAFAQQDDDGGFFRNLAVLLDVTERNHVARTLTEKTAALERSNADLLRFAQIASHDLQEPLRRVIAYSGILREDFRSELSEEAVEITETIQSGGRRLRWMIDDLLAYVRLSEQLDQAFEPVDLSAVISHALDDLDAELVANDLRVDVAHLPLVWGRAPLFKMLFHHLLANAIRHGGKRSAMIDVTVEDGGDTWRFAVTDRGVGVAPRFADRIFEIFQRLEHHDAVEGSGAGLAICRLIVQRCGGNIGLDPSYRDGARFLFTLPKAVSASSSVGAPGDDCPRSTATDIA